LQVLQGLPQVEHLWHPARDSMLNIALTNATIMIRFMILFPFERRYRFSREARCLPDELERKLCFDRVLRVNDDSQKGAASRAGSAVTTYYTGSATVSSKSLMAIMGARKLRAHKG
jgi:hypothetical protein